MLRPGYKLLDRKVLAGPLLNSLYEKEMSRTIAQITGSRATLMLDGWSTKTNDPVLAATLAVDGRAYLVGAEDTTGCPHTSQYLLQVFSVCTASTNVHCLLHRRCCRNI